MQPLGSLADQSGRDGRLDVLEFVVDSLIADRAAVGEVLRGGVDGGLPAEDDVTEEIDEGGEEEVTRVLALGGVGEESVDALGIEDAFQDTAGQDTHRTFRDERLKETFE